MGRDLEDEVQFHSCALGQLGDANRSARVRRAGAKDGNQEIGSGVRDLAVLSERWRGANEDAHARDADNSLERAADLLDQHERAQRTQLRSEASLLECDLGPRAAYDRNGISNARNLAADVDEFTVAKSGCVVSADLDWRRQWKAQ